MLNKTKHIIKATYKRLVNQRLLLTIFWCFSLLVLAEETPLPLSIESERARFIPATLTGSHRAEAIACASELDAKLREIISRGNNADTRAAADSTTGNQSLERLMKIQADQVMLKMSRAFIKLRDRFQGMPQGLTGRDLEQEIQRRLSGTRGAKTDTGSVGALRGIGETGNGRMSDGEVDQTLYDFYSYIQSGGAGTNISETPMFQDPTQRRRLFRSLQLYTYNQESGDNEKRYEIYDRDIFVAENLFNFYRPTKRPSSTSFFDRMMEEMSGQFRGGQENNSSDAKAVQRQIDAKYTEHVRSSDGSRQANSDLNYEAARQRFIDYIKNEIKTFLSTQAAQGGPCRHFYDPTTGLLKSEYQNKMCFVNNMMQNLFTRNNIDDFTQIYAYLNPSATPSSTPPPDLGYNDYNPEMHARKMYHNLRSCRVFYDPRTKDWKACLQLYIEHAHDNEASSTWFINTGQEVNPVPTTTGRGRITCDTGSGNYATRTRSETYMIASDKCISRPMHLRSGRIPPTEGTTGHDDVLSPQGCADPRPGQPDTRYIVNLGDTFQPSVTIIGTQGSVNVGSGPQGPNSVIGPMESLERPGTSASPWRENANAPTGQTIPNYRTLDLNATCRPSVDEFKAGRPGTGPASAPTEPTQIAIVETKATERTYALKARITQPEGPPRRGTYRWKCAEPTSANAIEIGNPTYQEPVDTIVRDTSGPCVQRSSTENADVTAAFSNIKAFAEYPRLAKSYVVKVKYYSTVQAPTAPEATALVPEFTTFKMSLTVDPSDSNKSILRAVPVNIRGEEIPDFFTSTIPDTITTATCANPSTPELVEHCGRLAARQDLRSLLSSGTINVPGCATPRAPSIPDSTCEDLNAATGANPGSAANVDGLFSTQGISIRTPRSAGEYTLHSIWRETAPGLAFNGRTVGRSAHPTKSSAPLRIDPDPYSLTLARGNETAETIECTPTFVAPAADTAAARNLRWLCTEGAPTEGDNICPTIEAITNPSATSGTAKRFARTRRTYQVTAYASRANGEVIRSNSCEITERGGDRVNVAIARVNQNNPLIARLTVTFSQPSGVSAFPGIKKITCPNAPDGSSCKPQQIVAAAETSATLNLPVPLNGTAYNVQADYIYTDTALGVTSVSEPVSPVTVSLRWDPDDMSVEGVQKVRASLNFQPINWDTSEPEIPPDQLTVFRYHADRPTVPTPPGSADVDKRSARAEKVDYKRFSTADGGAYNVVAHATIGGIEITSEPHPIQSNDMTITIAAQQVTPSPANIFKARARVTIRPASAAAPAGSVLKWFCDGPGKPANCDKNVNPAADGSDDFPRDTENRSYTITAKLMPATGTEALATSTTLTVDPVPAATFRITAEDRKTDRDPKTDFIAKVFNGSETAEYTLAAGESIRWAWKDLDNRDQTANGPTLVTDRKARSMSGKVFLLRGEAKLAETNFTIDAKDSCRQRGPAGNCLDREPEEEEEAPPEPIVLPDVAPNGAAPPNFIPITLPPRGGMQIMRGFN